MMLVEFLLTRIAEDEALARGAATMPREDGGTYRLSAEWTALCGGVVAVGPDEAGTDGLRVVYEEGWPTPGQAIHIAYWDPARVLIECKAKRGVIMANAPYDDIQVRRQTRDLAGATLRLLALPYASHPDYDESWRP